MFGGSPTVKIIFSAGSSSTTASTSTSTSTIPAAAWTAKTVGFVNCSKTTRYSPSGGGWLPDPLFSATFDGSAATKVNGDVTNSFYASLAIPRGTAAGKYTGTVLVTYGTGLGTYTLPVHVDVWAATLPEPESMFKSFGEIWSFTFNQFTGDSKWCCESVMVCVCVCRAVCLSVCVFHALYLSVCLSACLCLCLCLCLSSVRVLHVMLRICSVSIAHQHQQWPKQKY